MATGVFREGSSVKFGLNPDTFEVTVDVEMPETGPQSVKDYATYINTITPVTPEETRFQAFGDINDPAEARYVIQAAIETSVLEKRPYRADNRRYETKGPVNWVSEMILEAKGNDTRYAWNTLTPAGAAAAGLDSVYCSAFNPGNYHPRFLAAAEGLGVGSAHCNSELYLTWHAVGQAFAGQPFIVCSTPADAANYAAGDIVWVRDTGFDSQYNLSGSDFKTNEIPVSCPLNVVESADTATGIVLLRFPIVRGFTTGLIAQAVNPVTPVVGFDNNHDAYDVPLFAVQGVRIDGGGFISEGFYPSPYCAAVGCEVDCVMEGTAPFVMGGLHNSRMTVTVKGTKKLAELAMCSSGNDITIYGSYDHVATDATHAVLIGENSFGNKVNIDARFNGIAAGTPAHSLVYYANAQDNDVKVSGKAAGGWYAVVSRIGVDVNLDGHDPTQTWPLTSGNKLDADGLNLSEAWGPFESFDLNAAGALQPDGGRSNRENVLIINSNRLVAPTDTPIRPGGDRNRVQGRIEKGTLNLPTSGYSKFEMDVRGDVNLGNLAAGAYKLFARARCRGVEHPAELYQVSTSSTIYTPDFQYDNQEITFTGASFRMDAPTNQNAGRRKRIVLINGTAGPLRPVLNTAFYKLAGSTPSYSDAVTATQATSKATAVTQNGLFGFLTLNASSLAAGAEVEFTMTNSALWYPDGIKAEVRGGVTGFGNYAVTARCVSNNTAKFTVRNLTAGALAEALIIEWQVMPRGLPMLGTTSSTNRCVIELEKAVDGAAIWIGSRPIASLQ